jgi:EAL domain-containing protein (putative c-di-GMP-specific phosphodiesterase class I)
MTVVAEGIESFSIIPALRAVGIDFGQGYAFSRPIPAEECERWLDANGMVRDIAFKSR